MPAHGGREYQGGGGGGGFRPGQPYRPPRAWGPRLPPGGPGGGGFHAHRYGAGCDGYGTGTYLGGYGYEHDVYPGGGGPGPVRYPGELEVYAGPQHDGYGGASYGGSGWDQGGF